MPLPSRVDDYSSDEGFEVPLPAPPKLPGSFRDLVSNSPGSVASLLKRFHTRRDHKRYALADELHWILVRLFTPDNVLDGCLNSNLAIVLVEIASDPSLFGKFRHDEVAKAGQSCLDL